MKALFVSLIAVASLLAILFGCLYFAERSRSQKVSLQLSEAKRVTVRREQALEERGQIAQMLENKVQQLTTVLTNSTAQLQATRARLEDAERALAAKEAEQHQEETARQSLGQVPAPAVTVAVGADGKESRTFAFPRVLDRDGLALGTNMTFIQRYGRKLVFRPAAEGTSISVDVNTIHPAILSYLSIDAESAKADQSRIDTAWRAKEEADRVAAREHYLVQQQRQEAEERIRIERDKANAEIARLSAEEQAKREYAENERIKALAAARMADAAISGALAPVNINQNLNQNLNRNPYWR